MGISANTYARLPRATVDLQLIRYHNWQTRSFEWLKGPFNEADYIAGGLITIFGAGLGSLVIGMFTGMAMADKLEYGIIPLVFSSFIPLGATYCVQWERTTFLWRAVHIVGVTSLWLGSFTLGTNWMFQIDHLRHSPCE